MNEDQPRGRREPGCARIGPREAQHTRISVLADKTLADLAWRVRSLGQKLPLRFPDPVRVRSFRSWPTPEWPCLSWPRCDMRGHGRVVAWAREAWGGDRPDRTYSPGPD